jgi:cytochrome P450
MNETTLRRTAKVLGPVGRLTSRLPSDTLQLLSFVASPAVRAEPWPLYRRLHARGPVRATPFGIWLAGSHSAVTTLLRHPDTSVDEARAVGLGDFDRTLPFTALMSRSLLFLDPPDHARLRRLVARAFTPRTVAALRPRIEAQTDELVAGLAARGGGDLIAELALPLPVAVICDLLGVPTAERARFLQWARHLAPRLDIDLFRNETIERLGDQAATELAGLLDELIADPSRRDPDGLLAALVDVDDDGDRFTRDEIVSLCALLLVAGFETTTNLIGNGLHALLREPEELARVRDGEVDVACAVEELLRVSGPVQFTQRVLTADVSVDGHDIPGGTLVGLLIGAANRDPLVFADPDRLDVGREPNPHLSFSSGIHHCLGASLARLEAAIVLEAVLRHLPNVRVAARPSRRETFVLRGFTAMPLRWDAPVTRLGSEPS